MSDPEYEAEAYGLNFHDIIFILFKHKWKISLCATAGILAAVAVYFLLPPVYESQAKLLVRYVVEKNAVDALDPSVKTPGIADGMSLINSEVEILTSRDLIMQVAQTIGIDQLQRRSSGKGTKPNAHWSLPEPELEAVRTILQNLRVTAVKETNIISVSYKNSDPDLAVKVLQQLVSRYFDKHLEVHRSSGAFEFVRKETDQLRTQLNQTEKELKELNDKAGIISSAETETTLTAELMRSEEELSGTEAEFAAQQARVKKIESGLAWAQPNHSDNAALQASSETIHRYQVLVSRVAHLGQTETDLLAKYTPENVNVKVIRFQIEKVEKQRRDLEEKYPGLLETVPGGSPSQVARRDLVTEKAQLLALEAKTAALRFRVTGVRERIKTYSEIRGQLAELERKKAVEETNYKYFESSLERARIDETLDPSRMPNISVVQRPVTAEKYTKDKIILMLSLAIGGPAAGMAIALLTELVMDQTVKRRVELETRLSIPLVFSIPYFGRNGHSRLRLRDAAEELQTALPGASPNRLPFDSSVFMRPFCEAIRDRLILDFERNRMTHKPKLVAVTACSDGAGASTLAAGLTSSLLETGEKVILVDELYAEKRRLINSFAGSDFDYVIYDLPCLNDTSPTLALAGFMDQVLLVVEAGKSNRETVKRACAQLAVVKAKVSVVFNKSRSYGPRWLQVEV